MKKVLITGVAGLLGSRLADWIIDDLQDNIEVHGIDDLSGGFIDNIHPKVKFYQRNLVNDNLEDIFQNNFEYVYHFISLQRIISIYKIIQLSK